MFKFEVQMAKILLPGAFTHSFADKYTLAYMRMGR